MTVKISDIVKGTKLFCISVSKEAIPSVRRIDGVQEQPRRHNPVPELGIFDMAVYGDPILKDGKLVLGLGFAERGNPPDRPTALDVVGDAVPHYYLTREEAEQSLVLAKVNLRHGLEAGLELGQRQSGYVHVSELKADTELFFVEKQPAELSHPICLAERYRPGQPSLVLGHWKLEHDGVFVDRTDGHPSCVSVTVASDRPSTKWNYNLPIDHEGLVPHFFLSRDVAQRHLDTALWAINSFTHESPTE